MERSEVLSNQNRCLMKQQETEEHSPFFQLFSSSVNWALFMVTNSLTHYRSRWFHWENTWGNWQNKNLTPVASLTQEKLHSQASWWHGLGDSFMDWSPGGHLGLREAPNMSSCIFTLVWAPVCMTLYLFYRILLYSYSQLTDSLKYSPCLQIWLITVSWR